MTMAAPRPEAKAGDLSYESVRRLGGVYDTQQFRTVACDVHLPIDSAP